jgi:hypothetical protein
MADTVFWMRQPVLLAICFCLTQQGRKLFSYIGHYLDKAYKSNLNGRPSSSSILRRHISSFFFLGKYPTRSHELMTRWKLLILHILVHAQHQFLSSGSSNAANPQDYSFTVSYLIDPCGYPFKSAPLP